MREAKFVATLLGTVTACLFSGLAVANSAAPNVMPKENVEIVESASAESTVAATETSVSTATVAITTTSSPAKTTVTETTETTVAATTTTAIADTEYFVPDEFITVNGITLEGVQLDAAFSETPKFELTPVEPITTSVTTTSPVTTTTTATAEKTTAAETTTTDTTTTSAAPTGTSDASGAAAEENGLPISESDYILLCNVVGHEAGSSWISDYDKALVVEVVMNRVNSPLYPNTIFGVITQPNQFSGCSSYCYLTTFSQHVTESVKNAVKLYFSDPSQFSHGYYSFWGDGRRNYFR